MATYPRQILARPSHQDERLLTSNPKIHAHVNIEFFHLLTFFRHDPRFEAETKAGTGQEDGL